MTIGCAGIDAGSEFVDIPLRESAGVANSCTNILRKHSAEKVVDGGDCADSPGVHRILVVALRGLCGRPAPEAGFAIFAGSCREKREFKVGAQCRNCRAKTIER